MLRIVEGSLVENLPRMQDMMREHWSEVGSHPNVRALNVPEDRYAELEQRGMLLSLFALDDDDHIAGYSINVIAMNMHSADTKYVQNDALFLHKSHRKGREGIRLMKETEKAAKGIGAKILIWHAKEQTGLDRLLPLLGYEVLDVMYSKEL